MIAVTLIPRSTHLALRSLERLADVKSPLLSAAKGGDAVALELRLDASPDLDLARLLAAAPCPAIATCRPRREGGFYDGPEQPRLQLLREAARLGAQYIDIEHDAVQALGPVAPAKRIVSYHNFKETPDDLEAIHARLASLGADVVKLAVAANHILDTVPVLRLLRATRTPTIALSMGERGLLTRILAPKFGAFLTYASFDEPVCHGRSCPAVSPPGSPPPAPLKPGDESRRSRDESPGHSQSPAAPGQLPLAEMLDLYRVHRIGRATRVFGVIADPVAHSLSPAIHNAAFAETGLDAVYLPFWVEGDPAAFLRAMREFDFDGYSVTIPHKQGVMPALDDLAPLARRIGAVNTVVRRPDGSLFGTNTDISAAVASIEAVVGKGWLKGKRALLVGAGGLGRAIAFALADAGALLTITDIDLPRAQSLAREVSAPSRSSRAQRSEAEGSRRAAVAVAVAVHSAFRIPHSALPEAVAVHSALRTPHSALAFDVVLNCSPVGMHPDVDASPVPAEMLRKDMVVYDAVYNPAETRLLRDARAAGCLTVAGIDHFVRQAVEQFELWTRQPAPADTMRRVLLEALA